MSDKLKEALKEVVAVSKSGADTVSFLVELQRVAKVCAAALASEGQDSGEIERLRAENLNLQDRMSEFVGPITDEERLELIRYRVSYPSLMRQYEALCCRVEALTGRDPRLPHRDGD